MLLLLNEFLFELDSSAFIFFLSFTQPEVELSSVNFRRFDWARGSCHDYRFRSSKAGCFFELHPRRFCCRVFVFSFVQAQTFGFSPGMEGLERWFWREEEPALSVALEFGPVDLQVPDH